MIICCIINNVNEWNFHPIDLFFMQSQTIEDGNHNDKQETNILLRDRKTTLVLIHLIPVYLELRIGR